jgi:hypothetical protein
MGLLSSSLLLLLRANVVELLAKQGLVFAQVGETAGVAEWVG